MESFYTMLRLQTMLLIFLLVGIYIRKRNIVPKEGCSYFTEFLVRISLPCMVFHSFLVETGREMLLTASKALVLSTAVCTYSFLLGLVLFRRAQPDRRSVMRYGTLISNAGFAGLPQVQGAYGSQGLLYGSIYLIPLRIFMWSGGISLFMKASPREKTKKVLTNPSMLAVFAGLLCMLLEISLPTPVDSAIKSIGDSTNSLSMIVIGMVVADIPWRTVICKDTLILSLWRLLLIPLSVLVVLKAIGVDSMLLGITVMLTAMPVGVNTTILAQKYGSDYAFASKCVLLSTVLSLFTLPLISLFLH